MYKAQSAQTPPTGGPAPGGDGSAGDAQQKKDEGVIDAEYVDVDEKK
jgi:molecular chaperone DnaK